MKRPRLNILRTFEAAGRHLSFSLAAKELNITQAAVSQQVRHLEQYLGANLFVRHHRRLSMTSTGNAYLDGVNEALNRLDTITDQLFPDRPHQVVIIRCTSSVALLWLSPHIKGFQEHNPEIDLQIRTLDAEKETARLANTDIEIFVSGKPVHDRHTKKLLTSVITPVASVEYLNNRRPENASNIVEFDLIHVLGYEDDWHRWFQTFQIDTTEIPRGLAADSSLFAIDAALRGEGILLGRQPFIDAYLKSGKLVEVFSRPHHLHANYYMRQTDGATNTRNKKTVANWLQSLAE